MGVEVAMLALSAASAAMQMEQAQQAQDDANAAAAANYQMVAEENQRLMVENNEIAVEQKSDRLRDANLELGTLRAASELGISDTSMTGLVVQMGYNEGLDLSRIEGNRRRQQDSLEASTKAGRTGYLNTTQRAANQANTARTNAALGFVSSGLQIKAGYDKRIALEESQ